MVSNERLQNRAAVQRYYQRNKERLKEHMARWRKENPAAYDACNRMAKLKRQKRVPKWAEKDRIVALYEKAAAMRAAGQDVEVDHIIPLQGKLVSGLHVFANLRIISAEENRCKYNSLIDQEEVI